MYRCVCLLFCVGLSGCLNTGYVSQTPREEAQQEGKLSVIYEGTITMMRPTTIANKRWVWREGYTQTSKQPSFLHKKEDTIINVHKGHHEYRECDRRQGIEYFVRLKDGRTISVSQDQDLNLFVGQKVLVIENGDKTRIVAENQPGLVTALPNAVPSGRI